MHEPMLVVAEKVVIAKGRVLATQDKVTDGRTNDNPVLLLYAVGNLRCHGQFFSRHTSGLVYILRALLCVR